MAKTEVVEPTESRLHRFRVGDKVQWNDTSVHPIESHEGEVTAFDNVEGTYLKIEFDDVGEKVLTEDEVIRIAPAPAE